MSHLINVVTGNQSIIPEIDSLKDKIENIKQKVEQWSELDDQLKDDINKALKEKLGVSYEEYTKSLSEVNETVSWKLVEKDFEFDDQAIFAFNGSVNAALDIAIYNLNSLPTPFKNIDSSFLRTNDSAFLSISVTGKMEVGTEADWEFTKNSFFVELKGAAKITADGTLKVLSAHPKEKSFGEAVGESGPGLETFADFSFFDSNENVAVSSELNGEVLLSSGISGGVGLKKSFDKNGALKSISSISVGLEVGAEASWKMSGDLSWVSYKNANDQIVLELVKNTSSRKESTVNVGLGVTFEGLKECADKLLKEFEPNVEELQEIVDEYGDPKKIILDAVNKQVEDETELVKELCKLITGQEKNDKFLELVSEEVSKVINDKVSSELDSINPTEVASEIVEDLKNKTGLVAPPSLNEELESFLSSLKQDYEKNLKGLVDKVVEAAKQNGKLEKVTKSLETFGGKVDASLDDLNEYAKKALAPVKNIIVYYQKLLKFVESEVTNTIGFSYVRASSSASESSAVIKVTFKNSVDAEKIYKQCIGGDFRKLLALYRNNQHTNLFVLNECVLSRMEEDKLVATLGINFFGLTSESKRITDAKASVKYDGSGNLIVCNSAATFERVTSGGDESLAVKLTNLYNLLNPQQSSIGLTIQFTDKEMDSEELKKNLEPLEIQGVSEKGTLDKISSQLSKQGLFSKKDKTVLSIKNELTISKDEIVNGLASLPNDLDRLIVKAQCEALIVHANGGRVNWQNIVFAIQQLEPGENLHDIVLRHCKKSKVSTRKNLKNALANAGVYGAKAKRIRQSALRIMYAYYSNISTFRAYLEEISDFKEVTENVRLPIDEQSADELVEDLNDNSEEINEAIASWVKTFGSISDWGLESIHPQTVAFCKLMVILFKSNNSSMVTNALKQKGGDWIPMFIA